MSKKQVIALSEHYFAAKWNPWELEHHDAEDIKARVKTIPGVFWDNRDTIKAWVFPRKSSIEALATLSEFQIHPYVRDAAGEYENMVSRSIAKYADIECTLPDHAPGQPYDYQKAGINFINMCGGRALIADEQGLGKSLQTIVWANERPDERYPMLVVCPTSVVTNWTKNEAAKWSIRPNEIFVQGYDRTRLDFNYDKGKRIRSVKEESVTAIALAHGIKTLVIDECHRIKNGKAKQSKALRWLSKRVSHVLGLTGTPILNRHIDLYNILDTIHPKLFPFNYFVDSFCERGYWGGYEQSKNGERLNKELREKVMVRRLKFEVLTELPPIQYESIPFVGITHESYETALRDYMEENNISDMALGKEEYPLIVWMAKKRIETGEAKAQEFAHWITDFEEDCGEAMVIFVWHKSVAKFLGELLGDKALVVTGETNAVDKGEAVERFQNDTSIKYMVATSCLSEGVTLTRAHHLSILEYPYRPADLDQQCARIHRIGQLNTATIRFFHAETTIDDGVAALINRKRGIFNKAINDVQWIANYMAESQGKPENINMELVK